MKQDPLDLVVSFIEGAIEQQNAIVETLTDKGIFSEYEEGKLEALADVLEHIIFIKINLLRENAK